MLAYKLLSGKDDDYKRFNMNYDNQKKSLETELKRAYEEIRDMRGQAIAYENLLKDHAKLKDEREILINKVRLLSPMDSKDFAMTGLNLNGDVMKKVELLQADKDYLNKENIKLHEINKRLENKNDELNADLGEAKRSVQKYLHDLLDSKQNNSLSYEKRLNEDLAALRDRNAVGAPINHRENSK
jgi:DNA repair exonuclease SbcCD ATPase subunit